MNARHGHVDPVFAALFDALAPSNLGFPQLQRTPDNDDDTPDPTAPAQPVGPDEE